MNRVMWLALAGMIATTGAGCKKWKGWLVAPYKIGWIISADVTNTVTTIDYKIRTEEGEADEQKGTIGVGQSCSDAQSSSGTRNVVQTTEGTITSRVIGETPWDHPLLPSKENKYEKVMLSVVEESVMFMGKTESTETDIIPGVGSFDRTINTDDFVFTDASYYGVAADEYYVKVTDLDLWNLFLGNVLEDTDVPDEIATNVDNGDGFLAENGGGGTQTVDLMSKRKPKKGDIWTSVNGNFLYFAKGKEKVSFAGQTKNADRVEIFATRPVDPEANNLMEQCFKFGDFEDRSDDTGIPDLDTNVMLLNAGCQGTFTHQAIGVQHWVDGILVAQKMTTYDVTITEFGYEWFDDGGGGPTCNRIISPTKDDPNGIPFVQYSVTTTVTNYLVNSWEKDKKAVESPVPSAGGGGGGGEG